LQRGNVTAKFFGINDGSAAMLLANEGAIKDYQLKPMARIVSMAIAGRGSSVMGIGPFQLLKS
jgi:acetyl-CoA C-acetyltransferase